MFIPTDIYKEIVKYSVVPTADILFLDRDKKILLWLRNNAPLKWVYYLPGWRIQKWETIIQAVKRKSKEEVNIDIEESRLQFVGIYNDIFIDSAFEDISTHCIPCTFVYWLDNLEKSNIISDHQHSDMKFFSYNDPTLHPFLQERLQKIQSEYNIF